MNTLKKYKQGFTLIELLVVVLIIGILSAVALPQYQKAVFKARTAEAISMLHSLNRAFALCVLEQGSRENCATENIFETLVIDVPGTVTDSCSEDLICFQTKNWSYETSPEMRGYFYAYIKEGNTINNNFALLIGPDSKGVVCSENRDEESNMKTYAGYCNMLNLPRGD